MPTLRPYLSSRVRAAALAAGASGLLSLARPGPPPMTLEGLSALLSREVGGAVEPSDIVWEPARSPLIEALIGRRVLFLARSPDGPRLRDVHRAAVRVTPEGQPLEVRSLRNLTGTPLADEAGLSLRGSLAAHVTLAAGRVQGLTVLDLRGPSDVERPSGLVERPLGALASFTELGSLEPVGRSHVTLARSARSLRLGFGEDRVLVNQEDPEATFAVVPGSDPIVPRGATLDPVARVGRPAHRGRAPVPWLRGLLATHFGPAASALPWRLAAAVADAAQRFGSAAFGFTADRRLSADPDRLARPGAPRAIDAGPSEPPRVPSIWQAAWPGEGRFVPVALPWLPRSSPAPAASPYFHRTFVRPDPGRAFATVHLIALDLRQLALHLEPGYEQPRPSAGVRGTGRIPERAVPHVVAAFAVASRAGGGFIASGRTLVPPVEKKATLVVTGAGQSLLGEWEPGKVLDERIESLLQGESAMTASPSTSAVIEQSALCVTRERQAYYAWSEGSTRAAFGRALRGAGCERAIRLAERLEPAGFAFLRVQDAGTIHAELSHPAMSFRPRRALTGAENAFAYVTLRAHTHGPRGVPAFTPSPGAQPPPQFLPGIFEGSRKLGELTVRILSFEPGRVDWVLRAGRGEPSTAGGRPKKIALGAELFPRSLATIGLGHTTDALRYGLVFEGQPSIDPRRGHATLVLRAGEAPRVLAPGEPWRPDPGEDAVQVPLLADGGKLLPTGSDRGPMRHRGALCVVPGGATLVALARHDSGDPLVAILLEAGCTRVIGLDRGSRHAAFVHRAGTEPSPADAYEVTVLHALSREMSMPAGLL